MAHVRGERNDRDEQFGNGRQQRWERGATGQDRDRDIYGGDDDVRFSDENGRFRQGRDDRDRDRERERGFSGMGSTGGWDRERSDRDLGLWGRDREDRDDRDYGRRMGGSQADYDSRRACGRQDDDQPRYGQGYRSQNIGNQSDYNYGQDRDRDRDRDRERDGRWSRSGGFASESWTRGGQSGQSEWQSRANQESDDRNRGNERFDRFDSRGMAGGTGGGGFYGGYGQDDTRQGRSQQQLRRQPEHIGKGPKGYSRTDERLLEEIHERLSMGYLDASEIEVTVKNGEVVLKGTVSTKSDRRTAEDAIEDVLGVKEIDNRIKVKKQETSSSSMSTSSSSSSSSSPNKNESESERGGNPSQQHKRS